MNQYPEYLVYSVHVDPNESGIIDKVKAFYHYHPEDRVNTTRELTKYQLIEMIDHGTSVKTGIKVDGTYKVDHDMYVVAIYGIPYLKIRKNADTRDDLGNVETY